jgi:hypothetical protein
VTVSQSWPSVLKVSHPVTAGYLEAEAPELGKHHRLSPSLGTLPCRMVHTGIPWLLASPEQPQNSPPTPQPYSGDSALLGFLCKGVCRITAGIPGTGGPRPACPGVVKRMDRA